METALSFDTYRPLLFGIAYRMLGSVADAEDVVQDAYVRLRQAGPAAVQAPRAYLSTVVTRLCLDRLRAARVRREAYVGPWLPEPLVGDTAGEAGDVAGDAPDPAGEAELADTVSTAFLLLLERLSPVERAVFLLHEVFDYDYAEVAAVVGKREDHCRQIARRARQHLAAHRPRFDAPRDAHERLVHAFARAAGEGDVDGLVALLEADATLYSDGGGRTTAALKPIYGASKVARFVAGIRKKAPAGLSVRFADVNGRPGFVTWLDGRPQGTWAFDVADNRIRALYVVVNPDKLRHLGAPEG